VRCPTWSSSTSISQADGFTLARFLRERYDVGIIIVSAATEIADRVAGLEIGADDCVGKPFDLRERTRVKSVIRRRHTRRHDAHSCRRGRRGPRVRVGVLRARPRIAPVVRRRRRRGVGTSMEFDLLKAFIERPGQRSAGTSCSPSPATAVNPSTDRSTFALHDCAKIEPDPEHQTIRTVRGAIHPCRGRDLGTRSRHPRRRLGNKFRFLVTGGNSHAFRRDP
jgi:two-component system phosphate regulon response regulator OmpR